MLCLEKVVMNRVRYDTDLKSITYVLYKIKMSRSLF